MALNLGTIYAELGLRMDKFVQGAKEAKIKITALEERMKQAEEASDMLAKGVLATGAAMGAAGAYAITLAAQMEQSEIAFGTLLGSGEKAKAFLSDLAGFAAKTPFELRGLQHSSRMLLAFGFQAQDIIPMMTAVGDSVAALGGGEFEIQRVVRALGQMQAKGRVSAEEMMQLAELGIPVWEMLAKEIGVSIPEAMKLAETRAIDGMTGVNAILAGMQGEFAGAMEAQSKTIIGMWSTVKDNVSLSAIHLGNVLIEAFNISEHMESAIESLEELRITMEAFSKVVQERGIRAAIVELFGPGTTIAITTVAGAILGGLVPSIYAAAKALWVKFAALAALKPWLLAGAAASGLVSAAMVAQTKAAEDGTKSLQEHIRELRDKAEQDRRSGNTTVDFGKRMRETGAIARQTGNDIGRTARETARTIADAASQAQERIRGAISRVDRLHDALFRALRRKYERDRDAALQSIDEQFAARRNAIERQLGLLDETERLEDFHANRAERKTRLDLLKREANYETDARRREAILSQIAEIEKDLSDEQRRFDRDTRRKNLRDQLETLREEETNTRTAAEKTWTARLEEARLSGEAEKLIISGNQQRILELLKTYGDGWRDIGATFGQRLIEGMGPYPAELRRMVIGALNDVRAAADGTMAQLRKTAAQAVQRPAPAAAVRPAPAAAVRPAARPTPPGVLATLALAEPRVEPLRRPAPGPHPLLPQRELPAAGAAVRDFFVGLRGQIQTLLTPPPRPVTQGMGDFRRREAATLGTTVQVAGPLVQVQGMTVRTEADIEATSRQLHRHIQAASRARGGR